MANQYDKTYKFINAINEDAYLQQKEIELETIGFCKTELNKARQAAKHEIDQITAKERDQLKSRISRSYSAKANESRKNMLLHRDGITNSVFADTEKKLAAFARSDEYKPWLLEAVKKAAMAVNADDMIIYLRDEDMKYGQDILAAIGGGARIETDSEIRLGGCKIFSEKKSICANDTLESRLEDNREWFLQHFGRAAWQK